VNDLEKVLGALRAGPQGAEDLSRLCGIQRAPMFSLLMKMEKENLIVWIGRAWTTPPASVAEPNGDTDTSPPSEAGSDA
jgi:hypothetical protein